MQILQGGKKKGHKHFTLQLLDERHGHPGALRIKHHLALRHTQGHCYFFLPAIIMFIPGENILFSFNDFFCRQRLNDEADLWNKYKAAGSKQMNKNCKHPGSPRCPQLLSKEINAHTDTQQLKTTTNPRLSEGLGLDRNQERPSFTGRTELDQGTVLVVLPAHTQPP